MFERKRRWPRFLASLLGCIVIVGCGAVAINGLALAVANTIASDLALGGKPIKSSQLTAAKTGAPETIMIIGDDHIGKTTTYQTGGYETVNGAHLLHADTFMLVRLDPAEGQVSIMSIPRDLMVSFDYHGARYTQKFNATYALGKVGLTLAVAKKTLPGITVNHVIDFNFASFLGLVDAIGCVYIDVDRYYYNPPGDSYQPIDIEPGYQRLCGEKALDYVRYRHTDSDFVRVARQQDFIRQAKEQLGVWGFLSKWSELAKAFGSAVWTDIRGTKEVNQLLYLAAFSQSKPVREVPFLVSNPAYQINTPEGPEEAVLSSPQLIRQSIDDFLYETPKAALPAAAPGSGHSSHSSHHHLSTGTDDLYPLTPGTAAQALAITPDVGVPVYLPSLQTGPAALNDLHPYTIRDEQHHLHYGYRIDWSAGSEGEYYGIEGMNWTTPPLFANPNAVEKIDGRPYMFVDDGSAFHDIGWHVGRDIYWVSNTLNETLSNAQMLAIAQSAQPVIH
jgi:LCP family protein required for cell wall assembly